MENNGSKLPFDPSKITDNILNEHYRTKYENLGHLGQYLGKIVTRDFRLYHPIILHYINSYTEFRVSNLDSKTTHPRYKND